MIDFITIYNAEMRSIVIRQATGYGPYAETENENQKVNFTHISQALIASMNKIQLLHHITWIDLLKTCLCTIYQVLLLILM